MLAVCIMIQLNSVLGLRIKWGREGLKYLHVSSISD